MSEAIAFDTHKFVKRLTAGGFTERQAEILAEEQVNLLQANLASRAAEAKLKADLAAIEAKLKTDLAAIEAKLKADLAAVKAASASRSATSKPGSKRAGSTFR